MAWGGGGNLSGWEASLWVIVGGGFKCLLLVGGYVGMSVGIAITWRAATSVGISIVFIGIKTFVGIKIFVGIEIFVGIKISSKAARLRKRNI